MNEVSKTQSVQLDSAKLMEVMESNTNRVGRAVQIAAPIMERASKGMTAEIADEIRSYNSKAKTLLDSIKGERSKFTVMFDQIRKVFTTGEANLISTIDTGTKYLDQWTAIQVAEQRKKDAEANKEANVKKGLVEAESLMRKRYTESVTNFIAKQKQSLLTAFGRVTLDVYDKAAGWFAKYESPVLTIFSIDLVQPSEVYSGITGKQINDICEKVDSELSDSARHQVKNEITAYRDELIVKLPDLKKQLESATDKATVTQFVDDQKAKISDEASIAIAESSLAIDAEAVAQEVQIEHELQVDDTVEFRSRYVIEVTHPAGWAQIFQHWYERAGKDLPIDKFETIKMGTMRIFCEKLYKDSGTKIESEYVKYVEKLKAK